jgi:curved DNA-binding protein CbpA
MRTRRYHSILLLRVRVRVAFCLLLLLVVAASSASSLSSSSPYELLGVSRSASQTEIQKAYRQLCLKYHPDKNGNRPKKQQQRCEANFKAVEHAYSLIGDDSARRTHDSNTRQAFGGSSTSSSASSSSGSSPYGTDPITQAFFRAYATAANGHASSFFTHRSGPGGPRFAYRQPFPTAASAENLNANVHANFKSIYVQKVQVPDQVDSLVAKQMASLSMEDREKVYYDVYGVSEEVKETPEMVTLSLLQLELELQKLQLQQKDAYEAAKSMKTNYVENPED